MTHVQVYEIWSQLSSMMYSATPMGPIFVIDAPEDKIQQILKTHRQTPMVAKNNDTIQVLEEISSN